MIYETGHEEATISEIAEDIGISKREVDSTLFRLKFYFKYPEILDNEEMLIKSYIREYEENGQESARKEVDRRIRLASHIRNIKKENKN